MQCLFKVATVLAGKLFHRLPVNHSSWTPALLSAVSLGSLSPLSSLVRLPRWKLASLFLRWNLSVIPRHGRHASRFIVGGRSSRRETRETIGLSKSVLSRRLITTSVIPNDALRFSAWLFTIKNGQGAIGSDGSRPSRRNVTK